MDDRCRTLMWLQQLWKLNVFIFSLFQKGKESMKVCISVCILHYIGNTYQLSKVGVLRYCLTSSETSNELEKVNQGQFFYFFYVKKYAIAYYTLVSGRSVTSFGGTFP